MTRHNRIPPRQRRGMAYTTRHPSPIPRKGRLIRSRVPSGGKNLRNAFRDVEIPPRGIECRHQASSRRFPVSLPEAHRLTARVYTSPRDKLLAFLREKTNIVHAQSVSVTTSSSNDLFRSAVLHGETHTRFGLFQAKTSPGNHRHKSHQLA